MRLMDGIHPRCFACVLATPAFALSFVVSCAAAQPAAENSPPAKAESTTVPDSRPAWLEVVPDDSVITSKVKAKLLEDKEVSGLAVNVETFKGVVQLSGFVKSEAERQKAVQLARSVGGVKDIKNDIRLK